MTTVKMCFHNPLRNISPEERASIERLGYQLEADADCPVQYMYFMSKEVDVCPECSGNSSPLDDNPMICNGMICPVCNNLCSTCHGDEWHG